MTERLKRHLATLRTLVKAKPAKRSQILKQADTDLIKCLCECSINLLNANVPLDRRQRALLEKHKEILRLLANKKVSLKNKKIKILRKGGTFLLALLRPVLAVVSSSNLLL